MIDLNVYIAELLKPLARVELIFPAAGATFPVITINETANAAALIIDNKERISSVVFQIDVWDNGTDRSRTEELALKVDEIMLGAGFSRIFGQMVKEKNLHRKCLRYSADIDETASRIYKK